MEKPQKETKKDEDPENKIEFKTRLGRNVYRMLFKSKAYERNELFLPGRMAYVVDLDDEYADTDIPTTLIRSKADCPTMEVSDLSLKPGNHLHFCPGSLLPHLTHSQVLSIFGLN